MHTQMTCRGCPRPFPQSPCPDHASTGEIDVSQGLMLCCHYHQAKKTPPLPSWTGLPWLRTGMSSSVNDGLSWLVNCCDHDTNPVLDPPKGGPQNGGHIWIRNRPPKRCPPTVAGHILGGQKWTPKVAPKIGSENQASRSKSETSRVFHVQPCPAVSSRVQP